MDLRKKEEQMMSYKEKIIELYKAYVIKSIAYTKLIPEIYLLQKVDDDLDNLEIARNELEIALGNFHNILIHCKKAAILLDDSWTPS